jgi:hypothetical protein
VEGDPGGLAAFDAAIAAIRVQGLRFPLAITLRARALLSPTVIGAAEAANEARMIINELGAVTLLRGLPGDEPAAVPVQGQLAGRMSTSPSGATSEHAG